MKSAKRALSLLIVAVMLCSMIIATAVSVSAAEPLPHLVQTEAKWKNYYYGGGNLYDTGCGIFSMRNAIGYLTGYDIGITEPAQWAHDIGAYNVTGGEGTYRLVLYPKITAKYGGVAGFKVINSSIWGTAANTTLKSHLANGGVAIGHVPGHFIALVDYDYTTNKFHVLDSAPSSRRGTTSGYGDCWVTQDRLSTGKLDLDWFCLLSATGTPADEQDNEKALLAAAIEKAKGERYYAYSKSGVNSLRSAYDNAVAVYNSSSSTSENYKAARQTLESAMSATSTAIISTGKSYTVSNVWSSTTDDGKKLTDGDKGNSDGGNGKFVGAKASAPGEVCTEIVVDLGSVQNSNIYKIYMTAGDYGVAVPYGDQLDIEISVSVDNSSFTHVVSANNSIRTGVKNGNWETITLTAVADTAVSARYIKFKVTSFATNNYVWLDEVEVSNGDPLLSGYVYVNGINEWIHAGDCNIYTPSYGTITVDNANHAYTANVIAKWNSDKNAYVVTSVTFGNGSATPAVTLSEGEIMICANNWETGVTDGTAVEGSAANANTLYSALVGNLIYLDGIDIANNKISAAAYVKIVSETIEIPDEETQTHTHVLGAAATCDSDQVCLTCGEVIVKATGHDSGKWEIEENMQLLKCTVCGEILDMEEIIIEGVGETKPNDKVKLGDINANGEIDMTDYILAKRAYFGTYTLTDAELTAGDVNISGGIDMTDYVLIKRVYFGTFVFEE